jgi:hypothetical protein
MNEKILLAQSIRIPLGDREEGEIAGGREKERENPSLLKILILDRSHSRYYSIF